MSTPEVRRHGTNVELTWQDEEVAAEVRHVRDERGHVTAEIVWRRISQGDPAHLHSGVLSLTSTPAKAGLAKALEARVPAMDWGRIVEQLAYTVAELFRRGEPVVALRTAGEDDSFRIPLAIEPFIYDGLPFVLFGEPGSAKSYLGVLIAALAAIGGGIRGTPLAAKTRLAPLYLDWESHELDLRNRVRRIEKGLDTSLDGLIHYRFCAGPLSRSVGELAEVVADRLLDLVIIDSLGPAAGGDLNTSQSAQEFFEALRQLKCTSIILAHCAKNTDPRARSIYGSQFFTAHARGIAQVRRFQEAGEDDLCLGIYHMKSNLSRTERPFGLRLHFDGDEGPVTVHLQDLRAVPDLAASLSVGVQIVDALVREGPRGPKDLGEMLDVPAATVRKTLERLRDKGKVVRLGDGRYGAATQEEQIASSEA